jgi:nicotinate-nucleotide pyrophosphorylase (carboxylating)
MSSSIQPDWLKFLEAGLSEDGWPMDITSKSCLKDPSKKIAAQIIAKESGIWASSDLCTAVEKLSENQAGKISVTSTLKDGDSFKTGDILCSWEGPALFVLGFERGFLNLASYASGIATATNKFVKKAGSNAKILNTRKILPGYRDLAIHSVISGGGASHRIGLSGGILIKENHIESVGNIAAAISAVKNSDFKSEKIEIEVKNLDEVKEALDAGADTLLLDNFEPAEAKKAVALIRNKAAVEISGGLNEANIEDYAIAGVSFLSIGALTHSVKSIDMSLLVKI